MTVLDWHWSKRAAVAVELLPHYEAEAKKRMTSGVNQYSPTEKIPHGKTGEARQFAAQRVHVPNYPLDLHDTRGYY